MSKQTNSDQPQFIKFFLPKKLKQDAVKLANERNISLSAMLRLMLTEYIKNKK